MAIGDWAGRIAFITGGGTGIGFGIARAFSNAGMHLALSYRSEEQRERCTRWFEERGREVPLWIKLDVTDRDAFARAADQVVEHFGKCHVLVNNAGVSVFGPTDEASYADYDWIMGVNFGGVVNGIVSFIPKIKECCEGGHVINLASMAGYLSGPQAGIYTASKFAVRGLTESLRYNLAPYGIGVSLVCPALVATDAALSALKRPDEFSRSGFAPVDESEIRKFATAFENGMDPLEVGEKILRGMVENRGLIFTHPEFADDFKDIYETSLAALPDEEAPPERLEVERLRRPANKAALEGTKIALSDLS